MERIEDDSTWVGGKGDRQRYERAKRGDTGYFKALALLSADKFIYLFIYLFIYFLKGKNKNVFICDDMIFKVENPPKLTPQ